MPSFERSRSLSPRKTLPAVVRGILVVMTGLGLLSSGCAASSSQAQGCIDDNECNPGYICDNDTCVQGERDAAVYNNAFYIPPSDALP